MEVNTTIINDKMYVEKDQISVKGKTYAYLVNDTDDFDFCIKLIENDNYVALKDKEEFELALMYFIKKNASDLK